MGKHKKKNREYLPSHSVIAIVRNVVEVEAEIGTDVTHRACRLKVLSSSHPVITTPLPLHVVCLSFSTPLLSQQRD